MRHAFGRIATGFAFAVTIAGSRRAAAHDFQIGDVICAVMNGNYRVYDNNGVFIETIYDGLGGATTGARFVEDPSAPPGRLYVTDFGMGRVVVIDGASGHAILQTIDTSPGGGWSCESIVFDGAGDFYVGHAAGDQDVQRYDAAGNYLGDYDVAVGVVGSDWIELACDGTTLYYTSEGTDVRRYDLATSTQLGDFATALPDDCFGLRLLPPFDGSGGMLVAARASVLRLDGAGAVVQTYDVAGEDFWFSVELDPNGTSFWAGDLGTANFYRMDLASGAVQVGPIDTGNGYGTFAGMTVVSAPTPWPNDPPVFDQGPCIETVNVAAGLPLTHVVYGSDPDAGDAITLTASGVPAGATHTPALPLVGLPDQDLTTIFQWTPTVAQVGSHTVQYSLTDARCGTASCAVTIQVAESYLILGTAPGTDTFTVGGHVFDTQIAALRAWHVATPDSTPEFDAPPLRSIGGRGGPFGATLSGATVLDEFTVQALTYDPARFPVEPERFSGGLVVRVWNNGLVTSSPYGHARGVHVSLDVFVGRDGKRHYRFPITIDPPR